MEHLTVPDSLMSDWRKICVAFAKKCNAKLLFFNSQSVGIELKDGTFRHIYIDEMAEYLKNDK